MRKELTVNEITYYFKEEFDVNLALIYENDTWSEWHIVREFISNALDSVQPDISKVQINQSDYFINIHDNGLGYPVVLAK